MGSNSQHRAGVRRLPADEATRRVYSDTRYVGATTIGARRVGRVARGSAPPWLLAAREPSCILTGGDESSSPSLWRLCRPVVAAPAPRPAAMASTSVTKSRGALPVTSSGKSLCGSLSQQRRSGYVRRALDLPWRGAVIRACRPAASSPPGHPAPDTSCASGRGKPSWDRAKPCLGEGPRQVVDDTR